MKKLALALVAFGLLPLNACAVEQEDAFEENESEIEQGETGEPGELELACTASLEGLEQPCEHEHYQGVVGIKTCMAGEVDGEVYAYWGACEWDNPPVCDSAAFPQWDGQCCADELGACCDYDDECWTPLVLSFDDRPVSYATTMAGSFDLTGMGVSVGTDWPTATTPWLALDRDGDGAITSGAELFGSATTLASGALARHGFEALAQHDADGDGRITPADPVWGSLRLWADRDASRSSEASELTTLSEAGLAWIDLGYTRSPRCDARGNCEVERARFGWTDGEAVREGAIVDIHLKAW